MKFLKFLTRWIWKDELQSLNDKIVKQYNECQVERHRMNSAKRNFIDDIRDVARGSEVETQINEMIKQYE